MVKALKLIDDKIAERVPERDNEIAPNTTAYNVFKPIVLHVLGKEIATAHQWDKIPAVSAYGDIETASQDSPIIIWVHGEVKDDLFAQALKAHTVEEPSAHSRWDDIEMKADAHEPFNADEIQNILGRLVRGEL